MSEPTKVNTTCIRVQTCMHIKSIHIHVHTVMSCETQLFKHFEWKTLS